MPYNNSMEATPSSHDTLPVVEEWTFPRLFGRYLLLERLGGGGMGMVFRARDRALEVEAAVKVPHRAILDRPDGRERFLHEARAAARLDHPHFARVTDVGEIEGLPFLAMRYVPGQPLAHCRPATAAGAVQMAHSLAVALAEAHRRGVVHRDLKPANIIVTPDGEPVVTDFGLALRLDQRKPGEHDSIAGTPAFMAPEQVRPDLAPAGPACDIWALGVILYWMLTGRQPFPRRDKGDIFAHILTLEPDRPTLHRHDLDPALEAVCLKALAKPLSERFASMDDLAAALAACLAGAASSLPSTDTAPPTVAAGPLLPRESLRFAFAGYGATAPPTFRDRLFLDVGNDLRRGVVDHHQAGNLAASTTTLVLRRPDLVLAALAPGRAPTDPFTIVLHEHPDLDAVAATWLAAALLATGVMPPGAEALARYVDKVDEGSIGMSLANPFAVYAAYQRLAGRLLQQPEGNRHEGWRQSVTQGMELLDFAIGVMVAENRPLTAVDAFACPRLFADADRAEVLADAGRYQAKMNLPATRPRQVRLRLPGQFGGLVETWALCVRDVQNAYDPERSQFFKDWARTDAQRAPDGRGFPALCVFHSDGPGQVRRCIISVTPDSGATLRGLGALLDNVEADRRQAIFGVDDRESDPATGVRKDPRPGYVNADPWYDGRGHGHTIVDSPRGGTVLTAEEIEGVFLAFGGVAQPAAEQGQASS